MPSNHHPARPDCTLIAPGMASDVALLNPSTILSLPSEALANVAAKLIPRGALDGFAKFHLSHVAAQDAPGKACSSGRWVAGLSHVSKNFSEAVRLGAGGRVHFVGPVEGRLFERDILTICATLGSSVKELCLESIPDLSSALVARLATHLTALQSLFIFTSPAIELCAQSSSMSLVGVERLLSCFGSRIIRLRLSGACCIDGLSGTCLEDDRKFQIGAALLQHCVRLERLVIDIGMFDGGISEDDDDPLDPDDSFSSETALVNLLAPTWQAIGLTDLASRLSTNMAKMKVVLQTMYGFGRGALYTSRGPYNASRKQNLFDAYVVYSFWIISLTRSVYLGQKEHATADQVHSWIDPRTRTVMLRVESSDLDYFCDAMCSDAELDDMVALFELCSLSSGPRPTWLDAVDTSMADCTVHRTIVLDFLPQEDR
jgi:hypothetical protein